MKIKHGICAIEKKMKKWNYKIILSWYENDGIWKETVYYDLLQAVMAYMKKQASYKCLEAENKKSALLLCKSYTENGIQKKEILKDNMQKLYIKITKST